MKKNIIAIILMGVFLLTGCGTKSDVSTEDSNKSEIEKYDIGLPSTSENGDKSIAMENAESTEKTNIIPEENRKIINSADIYLETAEFDGSIKTLQDMVNSFGGYIESSNIYEGGISEGNYKNYRNANYTIRIPEEKFQNFLDQSSNIGVITNERTFAEDISSEYYDRETRLKVLQAQEERYLSILSEATEITEIIELEKALTEVRYEIESISGYLKQMDDLVDMSTVNITISEVAETSKSEKVPVTIGEKITKAFNDSIKSLKVVATGILLSIVVLIPYLAIFGVLSYVIYIIYRKVKQNKKPKE